MIGLIGPATSTVYAPVVPTPELEDALDAMYDTGRMSELIDPYALLEPLHAYFPTPPPTEWPRPRLNTLYWPVVGLAHYAFTTLLVDEYTLNVLRAQMTAAGTNAISVTLIDTLDGSGTPNPIPMYFLSSRPLVRNGTDPLTTVDSATTPMDAWVVTLVDERYYTLTTQVSSLTVDSWADLFSSLGVTVGDAVLSAYQTPSARWAFAYFAGRSAAWLADCAAMSVGSRIVTIPGGSPTLQRPTSTNATTLSSAHAAAVTDVRLGGGGPIESADTSQSLPADAVVSFGLPTEATPTQQGTGGVAHWADLAAATSGQSTLASQWYSDWVAWNSGYTLYDTLYDGFVSVPASGFLWAVVWEHTATVGTTRFVRPPNWYGFARAPEIGSSGGSGGSSPWTGSSGTTHGQPTETAYVTAPVGSGTTSYPNVTVMVANNAGNTTPSSAQVTIYQMLAGASTTSAGTFLQVQGNSSGQATQVLQGFNIAGGSVPQFQQAYTLGSNQPIYQTVQDIGTNQTQSGLGNQAGTQGSFMQMQQNSGGNVTSLNQTVALYNGTSAVSAAIAYTVSGSTVTATYPSDMAVNLSAANVTLPSSFAQNTEGAVTAAGSTQGTATALTSVMNRVSVPTNNYGVILQNIPGPQIVINLSSSNSLIVYPPVGASLGSSGTNTGVTIAPGFGSSLGGAMYWRESTTRFAVLSIQG